VTGPVNDETAAATGVEAGAGILTRRLGDGRLQQRAQLQSVLNISIEKLAGLLDDLSLVAGVFPQRLAGLGR
jgi:hypothetical protein